MADNTMPFDRPAPTEPSYPYGMRLCFDDHVLDCCDLDIGEVVEGTEVDIRAFGKVVAFSNDEGRRTVTVQLQRIKIENEDAEPETEEDE
jgi:hypothetical protein